MVEGRLNDDPDPLERYVWDLSYVDTPVVALRDTDTDGTLDARMYHIWDATRNITAVMFATGTAVAERYHYDPYGKMTVYTGTWGSRSSTLYGVVYTFTGREFDAETGTHYFRARHYDPALGRFLSRDPLGYVDGMSLYRAYFVMGGLDPSGMKKDELDKLVKRLKELDDEVKNAATLWPDEKLRDDMLEENLRERKQLETDIRNIRNRAGVAQEQKRLRNDAIANPLEAQESAAKSRLPEEYQFNKTDAAAKHNLDQLAREATGDLATKAPSGSFLGRMWKRFRGKLRALIPGPIGFGAQALTFPSDAEARGMEGATANQGLCNFISVKAQSTSIVSEADGACRSA